MATMGAGLVFCLEGYLGPGFAARGEVVDGAGILDAERAGHAEFRSEDGERHGRWRGGARKTTKNKTRP